jgi:glucan phosphoethanolaminetransferase (alkaline phosphatase superfamily)
VEIRVAYRKLGQNSVLATTYSDQMNPLKRVDLKLIALILVLYYALFCLFSVCYWIIIRYYYADVITWLSVHSKTTNTERLAYISLWIQASRIIIFLLNAALLFVLVFIKRKEKLRELAISLSIVVILFEIYTRVLYH